VSVFWVHKQGIDSRPINNYSTQHFFEYIAQFLYDYLSKLTMMSFINLPLSPPQEASNQPFGYLSHFPHSPLQMASQLIDALSFFICRKVIFAFLNHYKVK